MIMKASLLFLALAVPASGVTPVQKVIGLMNGMIEKGKAEKADEQTQYAAYKQFCDDTESKKSKDIEEANELIEKLKADIADYRSNANQLAQEIAVLDKHIRAWEGDVKQTTLVWHIDEERYAAKKKDLGESISALDDAVEQTSGAMTQTQPQFLQVAALRRAFAAETTLNREALDAFLAQEPTAAAYEGHSSGIVETLTALGEKFKDQMVETQREESATKHAFDMLMQERTMQLDEANADRTAKLKFKSDKLQAKAEAEAELADTTETRDEDVRYLGDTTATCRQKAVAFEKRQQLRSEELEAIEKAVEIVSSGAVAGSADKHLPAMLQTTLVQLKSESETEGDQQMQAVDFLTSQAKQLNSRVLSQLALTAAANPFGKVKKMIQDLIYRLMEEAREEAEHKGWCDTELATNGRTRKEKTDAVETLNAEIDELTASIAQLAEQLAELRTQVSNLDAAMQEATQLRQKEKTKNEETIADAQAAQTAVAQAITVLKDFYGKAAEATSFVQQHAKQPEIFDEPYTGMQAGNGGVVGMMEVIESDFARLEAETTSSEANGKREYDTFMQDSAIDKEAKTTDIDHKTAKKTDEAEALSQKKADLEGTQKELEAANAYFDKLKPSCVDAGVSYEVRVAQRKAEMESLQEALSILKGEAI